MTAGNDGASTPEDDDPFGYLYADGQASGATPPSGGGGYGYPGSRASYNQVRPVGGRQYGQPASGARGGYGYPPTAQGRPGAPGQGPTHRGQPGAPGAPGQSDGQARTAAFQRVPAQGYNEPSTHYQAPETLPGGSQGGRQGASPYGRGRGRGPNTRGLLIGAIAVVAAVAIGIAVAVFSDNDDDGSQSDDAPPAAGTAQPSESSGGQTQQPDELPKIDANALRLEGAVTASEIEGARAEGGVYVTGFNQPGASATWTVNGIPGSGKYTLHIGYGVPGKDAAVTLTVNGKPQTSPLPLKNYAGAKAGDWAKGWTNSYTFIQLNKGTNTLRVSCEQGNQCDVNLDQVWLEKGWKNQ